MISYPIYKIVHLVSIFMIFLAVGAAITNGNLVWRRHILITYALGLFLTLVGGFGLLARLGVQHGHMPAWAMLKIGIWGIFLLLLFLLLKRPAWAKAVWPLVIVLGGIAAYLAGSKPL